MKELILRLIVIETYAKMLHYTLSGASFYSNHLLMDVVSDPISDFVDDIFEQYYLPLMNEEIPDKAEILSMAYGYIKEVNGEGAYSIKNIASIIRETLSMIEGLSEGADVGAGDLLGRIAAHLNKSAGLLNRVLSD